MNVSFWYQLTHVVLSSIKWVVVRVFQCFDTVGLMTRRHLLHKCEM